MAGRTGCGATVQETCDVPLLYRHMLGLRYAAALLARHCVPQPMARRLLTAYRRRNPPPIGNGPPPF